MKRGSTPTNEFESNVDLTKAEVVYATYKQGGKIVLEKTGSDLKIEETRIMIPLSQEDTLAFREGLVEFQVRYRNPDGMADVSDILVLTVDDILKDGVI